MPQLQAPGNSVHRDNNLLRHVLASFEHSITGHLFIFTMMNVFCIYKVQPINMMMIYYRDKRNGGHLEHVL